ncbi:MAG: hypothetical protein LAO04_21590 [Acidobacteriia bacterium]|nr:hypothetical protein [Terriglobia bacterium]
MKELLAKLRIVGFLLGGLWLLILFAAGVYVLIAGYILNPNPYGLPMLTAIILWCLFAFAPLGFFRFIWWLLPSKWKPEKIT